MEPETRKLRICDLYFVRPNVRKSVIFTVQCSAERSYAMVSYASVIWRRK